MSDSSALKIIMLRDPTCDVHLYISTAFRKSHIA